MPVTYDFPTNQELMEIDKDYLDDLQETDPLFPIVEKDTDLLMWEQRDNTTGLMQARGINGDPPSIKRLGGKRFMMEPGVYGEFAPVDEMELTRRRPYGTFSGRININDLVTEIQIQLRTRQMQRARWIMWQLLVNGAFNVTSATGSLIHRDTFKQTMYASQVAWSTYATATPMMDFRAVKLLHRGHSVSFGKGAMAFANQQTWNYVFQNTNPADLYGRRTTGLGTYNSPEQIDALFQGDGLPSLVEYDAGYLSDGTDGNPVGSYQLYIPDNYVVLIGKRDNGAAIGEFRMTRNPNNLTAGVGVYDRVIDHGPMLIPRKIEVHRGFNGGPIIWFPSSVVVMKVG
jgi:hypothetical protein